MARVGYDPLYGARPLKRTIQNLVQNPLSKFLLAGKALPGQTIVGTLSKAEELEFHIA